jgi:tetratricopeptide (TPR) repeat protein
MQNFLLPASAWSKNALRPLGVHIHASLKLLCPRWWKWLPAGFCLAMAISAAPPAWAQETESVGDAARAFRAHRAAQANQDTARQPQPPLSATTLVAWQIAGMAAPDTLNELQLRGITFVLDDAHLNALKDARVTPELLAALPNVPSHPDASSSSEVPQAWIGAAQAFGAKDYAAARHALESLVQQNLVQQNQDANLYAALGNLNFVSGDLPSAKTAFLRSAQLDPSFAFVHVRLAQIYYRLEQGSQVADEAKQALRLQPNNAEARKYLALSIGMQSQNPDAASGPSSGKNVEDLSDLKGGSDTEAKDLNNQGIVLAQQKDWTKAEAAYRHAIELDPKVPLYYYNLGNLYMKWDMGPQITHTEQALAAFSKAKTLAPRNMAIRQNIGFTLCHAWRWSEAVNEFREMLSLDPYWNMARPGLAESLDGLGQRKEAYQVMKDYKRFKPLDDSGDDGEADSNEDDTGVKL